MSESGLLPLEPDMSEAAMEEDVLYGQLEGAIGNSKQSFTPARLSVMPVAGCPLLHLTGSVLLQGKPREMESQHSSHPLQTLRIGTWMLRYR